MAPGILRTNHAQLPDGIVFGSFTGIRYPGMNGVHLCHIVVDQHGQMFDDVFARFTHAIERLGLPVTSAVNALSPNQLNVLVGAAVMLDSPACSEVLESGMPFVLFQAEALDETAGFLQQSAAYWQLLTAAAPGATAEMYSVQQCSSRLQMTRPIGAGRRCMGGFIFIDSAKVPR